MNAHAEDREFRLALSIQDDQDIPGLHALLVLMAEEGKDTPVLVVQAGGVDASAQGAGMLADMLRDAADAIDDHLGKERPHTDTAAMPVVTRPKFNPRPAGTR